MVVFYWPPVQNTVSGLVFIGIENKILASAMLVKFIYPESNVVCSGPVPVDRWIRRKSDNFVLALLEAAESSVSRLWQGGGRHIVVGPAVLLSFVIPPNQFLSETWELVLM